MHPGQVFSDHAQCEKLRAGKDRNDRGEKRKSGNTALKKISADYLGRGRSISQIEPSYETLTTREREILKLLADGLSIKEVAVKLSISGKTADVHKSNLMRKLDIHDRTELVKYAIRNKLIKISH